MQKKKGFGCLKQIIAGMLALCLVIPDFVAPSVQAEAADMNYITPENPSGDIRNKDYKLTHYDYYENGDLVLTNLYNYVENITQTYHTVNTIWSKNKTGTEGVGTYCHPTESGEKGVDWVYISEIFCLKTRKYKADDSIDIF